MQKAVEKLMGQGKIKMFGVSNFTSGQTDLILSKETKVCVNQIQLSLSHNYPIFDSSLDYMMVNKIIPMSWSPLGSFYKNESENNKRVSILLDELSTKYNASKRPVINFWILKHPSKVHPVIGTTNFERISSASCANEIKLSNIDWFRMLKRI